MIQQLANVRLELESLPESVTLARSMVAGLAEATGLDEEWVNTLRTAISEAANNVVVHAYEKGASGPLTILVDVSPSEINVVVRDRGAGLRRAVPAPDRMGLGLAVIAALADRAEFATRPGGGTDVRLSFTRVERMRPRALPEPDRAVSDTFPLRLTATGEATTPIPLSGQVVGALSPPYVLKDVVGRVVRALAAQSHFPVNRLAEVREITDALASYAELHSENQQAVWFSLDVSARLLRVSVGPFMPGAGSDHELCGDHLAELIDELRVQPIDHAEFLHMAVADHRDAA